MEKMKATSQVLDNNGLACVTISANGYTRIYMARDTYEDCHDIVHTQEIGMSKTSAMVLRDKLNEVFPVPIADRLHEVPINLLLDEIAKRDLEAEGIRLLVVKDDVDIYANDYDVAIHRKNCEGMVLISLTDKEVAKSGSNDEGDSDQ